jgi:hypothetical protein
MALEGFADDAKNSNEKKLEAIQWPGTKNGKTARAETSAGQIVK